MVEHKIHTFGVAGSNPVFVNMLFFIKVFFAYINNRYKFAYYGSLFLIKNVRYFLKTKLKIIFLFKKFNKIIRYARKNIPTVFNRLDINIYTNVYFFIHFRQKNNNGYNTIYGDLLWQAGSFNGTYLSIFV